MSSLEAENCAREFFDAFVEAFASFNGNTIAERYLAPYLAFHTHESAQVFMSSAETGSYFQKVVDEYYAKGCRSCRYKDLAILPLGKHCALGTVTWELLSGNLTVIGAWRESYNLCMVEGQFRVFASTDHVA
jgi:hypothetical protein